MSTSHDDLTDDSWPEPEPHTLDTRTFNRAIHSSAAETQDAPPANPNAIMDDEPWAEPETPKADTQGDFTRVAINADYLDSVSEKNRRGDARRNFANWKPIPLSALLLVSGISLLFAVVTLAPVMSFISIAQAASTNVPDDFATWALTAEGAAVGWVALFSLLSLAQIAALVGVWRGSPVSRLLSLAVSLVWLIATLLMAWQKMQTNGFAVTSEIGESPMQWLALAALLLAQIGLLFSSRIRKWVYQSTSE